MTTKNILHTALKGVYTRWKSLRGYFKLKRCAGNPPIKIVIGASGIFDDGWVDTDVEYLDLLNPTHWERFFEKESIDAILAEHVWEHLTIDDGYMAARRCFLYLKPGGYIRVAVPDGFHPDPKYIDCVKVDGTGFGSDDHKVLFNHNSISSLFSKAGFRVELLEYFDSEGHFHCKEWDPGAGMIRRSKRFDERNANGILNYTSIILDAHKFIE